MTHCIHPSRRFPAFVPSVGPHVHHAAPCATICIRRSSFAPPQPSWPSAPHRARRAACVMSADEPPPPSSSSSSSSSSPSSPASASVKGEDGEDGVEESASESNAKHYALAVSYVAFAVYALGFAPGSWSGSMELAKIVQGDLANVNAAFFCIFNLLGAIGLNNAALLNAGASRQPKWLPTLPFSLAGTVLGYAGIAPYLILRKYVTKIGFAEVHERGLISTVLESRWFSLGTCLLCIYAYAFAFGLFTSGNEILHDLMFYSSLVDLTRLFRSDRIVCIACIDFVILSISTLDPLVEDMKRRGWFKYGFDWESAISAFLVLSTPGLGTALYLLLRPRLDKPKTTSTE